MLAEFIKKCKLKLKPYEQDVILVTIIILVALISFGLGRLSKIRENRTPITIENAVRNILASTPSVDTATTATKPGFVANSATREEKLFVASKNGTKYHYPWCPGALNIKEENKIWFSSKEQAEKAGYTRAGNCKGL
jgi:hypothetical protein